MRVEDVAGVRLAAGRIAEQERDLPVDDGVLGQVVDHQQRVSALVAEVFGDGAGGVGRHPLETGRIVARW